MAEKKKEFHGHSGYYRCYLHRCSVLLPIPQSPLRYQRVWQQSIFWALTILFQTSLRRSPVLFHPKEGTGLCCYWNSSAAKGGIVTVWAQYAGNHAEWDCFGNGFYAQAESQKYESLRAIWNNRAKNICYRLLAFGRKGEAYNRPPFYIRALHKPCAIHAMNLRESMEKAWRSLPGMI